MKLKLVLLTVIFLCGTILNSYTQVEGYIKSKARHAQNRALYDADKEVDNQIDKGVDKEFDKLKSKILGEDDAAEKEGEAVEDTNPDNSGDSDSKSKKTSKSSGNDAMSKALMGKMGINMERPANMKDMYEYTGNILMDLETWDDDGDSQGVVAYTTQYSDKNNGFAMEFQDKEKGYSTMIFDYDNQLMIILGDNGTDKSGFATQLGAYEPATASQANDPQAEAVEAEKVEDYYGSFKKTGKSKTIAGYSCDEYYYEDEEDMISYWMTNELPADLWTKMGTANNFSSVYTGRTSGFVMESDHRSKTSKERSLMIVKEVNPKKPGKISTVGYTVMSMKAPPPAPEPSEKENGDKEK